MYGGKALNGLIKLILTVILIAILAIFVYNRYRANNRDNFEAKIGEIKTMVRLSSLEVRDEMVITDTINNKVLAAIVKIKGSIGFDVEQLYTRKAGDTLIIQLPPEIIEAYESDQNKGYEIVDLYTVHTLNEMMGVETPLTSQEENAIKAKIPGLFAKKMYEKGYIRRARTNALETLAKLFSLFQDKTIIIDNYPDGYYGEERYPEILPGIQENF